MLLSATVLKTYAIIEHRWFLERVQSNRKLQVAKMEQPLKALFIDCCSIFYFGLLYLQYSKYS